MEEAPRQNIAEEGEVVDSSDRINENHVADSRENNKELSVTDYLNSEDFPTNGEDSYEETPHELHRTAVTENES